MSSVTSCCQMTPLVPCPHPIHQLQLGYGRERGGTHGEVNDLEPATIAAPAIDDCARDAREAPAGGVRVRVVHAPDRGGQDLVARGGDRCVLLDQRLFGRGERRGRRHLSGGREWAGSQGVGWAVGGVLLLKPERRRVLSDGRAGDDQDRVHGSFEVCRPAPGARRQRSPCSASTEPDGAAGAAARPVSSHPASHSERVIHPGESGLQGSWCCPARARTRGRAMDHEGSCARPPRGVIVVTAAGGRAGRLTNLVQPTQAKSRCQVDCVGRS